MKMKKIWFSYLLWLLYTAMTVVLLSACIITVSIYTWRLNSYFAIALVCFVPAGAAGIWLAGRKAAPYIAEIIPKDKHFANMWECFLAMCLFAGAILYRIHYILHVSGGAVERNAFYEMAQITGGGTIPHITHGASYAYTALLSTVFSFIGNKVMAGIVLQLVLQIIAMLFLYFALRLLTGSVTALCTVAFMAASPVFMADMCSLTPQGLYLLLYSIGLWFTGAYLKGEVKTGYRKKGSYAIFLLLGFYIGIVSYLDIVGVTLLFFAGMGFIAVRKKTGDTERQRRKDRIGHKNKNIHIGIQFAVIMAASVLAFAGLAELAALYTGRPFADILTSWISQYGNNISLNYSIPQPDMRMAVSAAVYFTASFYAVGFIMNKNQKADAWILLLLALTAVSITGIGRMDYGIFAVAVWGVMAGLGISSIGETGNEKMVAFPDGKEQQAAVSGEDTGFLEETDHIKAAGNEAGEKAEIDEEPNNKDTVREIKFIENPLPLPRKHVKKEMDYGMEVSDERMEYDISADENDDFDI